MCVWVGVCGWVCGCGSILWVCLDVVDGRDGVGCCKKWTVTENSYKRGNDIFVVLADIS